MNTFKWLMRREFWESRGGFFWAPMIAGAIFLVLNLMAFVSALVLGSREAMRLNGVDLGEIGQQAGAHEMAQLAAGLDLSLFLAATWPLLVLAFVVFFYCLGSLYDERRDRSVLFWKSLPISDRDTVLSKLATATLTAPAIATAAAVLTMLGFLLILALFALAHGVNPFTFVLGPASPLKVAFYAFLWIPVYAVWVLPTVGWLMLCSAWARSKPFLWAVMLPIFAGIMVTWFKVMNLFDLSASWFWSQVVGRLLVSTLPGSDLFYRDFSSLFTSARGPEILVDMMSPGFVFQSFALPQMWIGAAFGIAFIVIAIRLRRWRDEG